jgi:hypothetical protein
MLWFSVLQRFPFSQLHDQVSSMFTYICKRRNIFCSNPRSVLPKPISCNKLWKFDRNRFIKMIVRGQCYNF